MNQPTSKYPFIGWLAMHEKQNPQISDRQTKNNNSNIKSPTTPTWLPTFGGCSIQRKGKKKMLMPWWLFISKTWCGIDLHLHEKNTWKAFKTAASIQNIKFGFLSVIALENTGVSWIHTFSNDGFVLGNGSIQLKPRIWDDGWHSHQENPKWKKDSVLDY